MKKETRKEKKGVTYGKKRLRILNVPALVITLTVILITGALAVVCNVTGFDRSWYGDIVTTAVCIVCFFALLNLGYVLVEGITVENGIVFLGTDREKKPISFHVRDLVEIRLCDDELTPIPEEKTGNGGTTLRFVLNDGSHRDYTSARITNGVFRKVRKYFEI